MYLLLLLAIGASTASPLGFQGTPMNASRCHIPTAVLIIAFVCVPGTFPWRSMVPSFAISPRTMLKSFCLTHLCQRAVTLLASVGTTHRDHHPRA